MTNSSKENLFRPSTNFRKILPPPMLKDTHEYLAEAFERSATLKDKLTQPFGVEKDTVSAWARPKRSEINPYATGKGKKLLTSWLVFTFGITRNVNKLLVDITITFYLT